MTYEYHLISEDRLPKDFKYPKSYLHYLKYNETQEEVREYGCEEERCLIREEVDFFYNQVAYEYPDKEFVPFARLYDDEIFCFDGHDISGDPAIYVVNIFSNEYEKIYDIPKYLSKNFYQWLEYALEGQEVCGCWRATIPFQEIPRSFKFPNEYIRKIKIPEIESFSEKNIFFVDVTTCDDSYSKFRKVYDKVKDIYYNLNIIPFAYSKENNLYVFDGNNTTGNPKVYLLDSKEKNVIKTYKDFKVFWNDLQENTMFTKKNYEK